MGDVLELAPSGFFRRVRENAAVILSGIIAHLFDRDEGSFGLRYHFNSNDFVFVTIKSACDCH